MKHVRFYLMLCAVGSLMAGNSVLAEIQFARDIQPILSDHCYACHGPDANQRKAGFRLDRRDDAFRERDGVTGVVPGQPDSSAVIVRIEHADPDEQMPPPKAKLALTQSEKDLLRQWVLEGAVWEEHWAFTPPTRPALPTSNETWGRNAIDSFVSDGWRRGGDLSPSPEAAPDKLLRRVSIDLTGLAPSLEDLDRYLNDTSPRRYERAVDRLLNSDAYAERMALEWMDVARYADSHGMHADGWRMMWPWRDWVINAFKQNQPYDEFVTWQLAGDLMPDATDEQIIATAFHRNHAMTAEGGIVDEEFRLQYVFDRAQTTATAFLGLTLECARCHDHKFDPLSQKEYYQMAAFFNNLKELGMTGDDGNYGPMHLLTTANQKQELKLLAGEIERLESDRLKLLETASANPQEARSQDIKLPSTSAYFPFDSIKETGEKKQKRLDGNENARFSGNPELVEGIKGQAVRFDSEYDIVALAKAGLIDSDDSLSAVIWIHPTVGGKPQSIVGNAGAKNNFWRGWDFHLDADSRLALKLIHALPHSYIHVRAASPVPIDEWSQVAFTYDGSSRATGVTLYVNGQPVPSVVEYDRLNKSIYPVSGNARRDREDRALRLGKAYRSFTGEYGIYTGMVDDLRLYDVALTEAELRLLHHEDKASETGVNSLEPSVLAKHWAVRSNPEYQKMATALSELYGKRLQLNDSIPELMVMEELPKPRQTYMLRRGQYDAPSDPVQPGTPESVLTFDQRFPRNRLGLAQWLFDPENPLTARVTVNRYWQLFFGRGLVETAEDFGIQGSRPSHPELLDWLAVEFQESGWDLRQLHRLMVTSATYRQSSNASADARALDPENQWLSRGPSYRLPAELIRDQALSASGLLVPIVGGESVKPFQPKGLWIDKGNFSAKLLNYHPDKDEKLYRKSLYTFIRRTSPHPAMVAFDAPNRDVCLVRRERTNTPLQALVLMNDPQFVEAARVFAERIQREAGPDPDDQIRFAFRTVTSRGPTQAEIAVLRDLLEAERDRLAQDSDAAAALVKSGSHPHPSDLPEQETAALTVLANTLFNHDEFYTKR